MMSWSTNDSCEESGIAGFCLSLHFFSHRLRGTGVTLEGCTTAVFVEFVDQRFVTRIDAAAWEPGQWWFGVARDATSSLSQTRHDEPCAENRHQSGSARYGDNDRCTQTRAFARVVVGVGRTTLCLRKSVCVCWIAWARNAWLCGQLPTTSRVVSCPSCTVRADHGGGVVDVS